MSVLYKITAFHCPGCGGAINPQKKYCDWCGRKNDIYILKKNIKRPYRVLVETDNGYIHFNDVTKVDMLEPTANTIDCTYLEDDRATYITGHKVDPTFNMTIPLTLRGNEELLKLKGMNDFKLRIEVGDFSAIETIMSMRGLELPDISQNSIVTQSISMDCKENLGMVPIIPRQIANIIHCKNCGAPLKSRIGACDFCGGWNEVEW